MIFNSKEKQREKQYDLIKSLYIKYDVKEISGLYQATTSFETALKNELYQEYLQLLLISEKVNSHTYMNLLTFNDIVSEFLHIMKRVYEDNEKNKS